MKKNRLKKLLPLWALLTERSITKAAEKIGISQPAMSSVFKQLKAEFDDPLLVRTGSDYALTDHAVNLKNRLVQIMPEIEALWQEKTFDPDKTKACIKISGRDHDFMAIAEQLLQIRATAPGLSWQLHSAKGLDLLAEGQVDLTFTLRNEDFPGLYRKVWSTGKLVCVANRDSKWQPDSFHLQEYLKAEHIVLRLDEKGTSPFDLDLQKQGIYRQVAVKIPSFALLPAFFEQK